MKRTRPAFERDPLPDSAPLALSEASMRLRAARQEHDKLLGQIRRRRESLERLEDELRAAITRIDTMVRPLMRDAHGLDSAIHRMLQKLATDPRRPRQQRKKIEAVYLQLQAEGVIRRRPNFTVVADDDARDPDPFFGASQAPESDDGSQSDIEAPKESRTGAMRTLFRNLAELLHPDKVQREEDKASRTEVMKEITVAYRDGDYARLIEIERTWAAATPVNDTEGPNGIDRRTAVLVQANLELRKQLRALDRELRNLRNSHEAALLRDVKDSAHRRDQEPLTVRELRDEVEDLRRVHDFIRSFHDGKIGFATFIAGPNNNEAEAELYREIGVILANMIRAEQRERTAHRKPNAAKTRTRKQPARR